MNKRSASRAFFLSGPGCSFWRSSKSGLDSRLLAPVRLPQGSGRLPVKPSIALGFFVPGIFRIGIRWCAGAPCRGVRLLVVPFPENIPELLLPGWVNPFGRCRSPSFFSGEPGRSLEHGKKLCEAVDDSGAATDGGHQPEPPRAAAGGRYPSPECLRLIQDSRRSLICEAFYLPLDNLARSGQGVYSPALAARFPFPGRRAGLPTQMPEW